MAQLYVLPCSCGQSVRVGTAQAGSMVACACGKSLQVPAFRDLRDLPTVESGPAVPESNWSSTQGTAFVVGCILAAAGMLSGGLATAEIRRINPRQLEVETAESITEGIDKMTPERTLRLWRAILNSSLGTKHVPAHVIAKERFALYRNRAIASFAVAALGIVTAAASAFTSKRQTR